MKSHHVSRMRTIFAGNPAARRMACLRIPDEHDSMHRTRIARPERR